jgi:hypothetical protein
VRWFDTVDTDGAVRRVAAVAEFADAHLLRFSR